mmetsp:Transcript_62303/g.126611  ORF Transcript_62303/g.126611 Transcript_62303/m.126611 type:complete len:131 (-) Transcript_62303:282-674(-)
MARVQGVLATRVGYTGGTKSSGVAYRSMGDHTEACQVDFDPRIVSYQKMLDLFFSFHNPFSNKSSRQYRNCLWYHDDAQKKAAQAYIAEMNAPSSSGIHRKVVTPLEPKGAFYLAEEYHQQYNAKARGRY